MWSRVCLHWVNFMLKQRQRPFRSGFPTMIRRYRMIRKNKLLARFWRFPSLLQIHHLLFPLLPGMAAEGGDGGGPGSGRSAFSLLMAAPKQKQQRQTASKGRRRSTGSAASPTTQTSPATAKTAKETVECPLCGGLTPLLAINTHMDYTCPRRVRSTTAAQAGGAGAGAAPLSTPSMSQPDVTVTSTATTHPGSSPPAAKTAKVELPPASALTASPSPAAAVPTVASSARTGTVHDFFGGQDHTAPGFFLLDMAGEATSTWRARFVRQRPAGAHGVVTCKWQGKDLRLAYAGRVSPVAAGTSSAVPAHSACYSGQVPLLKSHLQVTDRDRWKGLLARAEIKTEEKEQVGRLLIRSDPSTLPLHHR